MTREDAVQAAYGYVDSGRLLHDVSRRVRRKTVSADPERTSDIQDYMEQELLPVLGRMGFHVKFHTNPASAGHPFLLAVRQEPDADLTVLSYGHADVQPPQDGQWRTGLEPWEVVEEGNRWYGRGTADNKAQHSINLAALEQVIAARKGKLGATVKLIIESGEEVGSPGLEDFCATHSEELSADLFIGSDGPRLNAETPTLFMGSRGMSMLRLDVALRERSYHSGNWGGLLANPGTVLAGAISSLVDPRGRILVEGLRPGAIPQSVSEAVRELPVAGGPEDPDLSEDWGEPGLTPGERVFAWNTLEVVDFLTGDPWQSVGAIPATAAATLQLRFVVGTEEEDIVGHVRQHLDHHGFPEVEVRETARMSATRLEPDHPWVRWAEDSVRLTSGKEVALLPNLGGSLPNRAFAEVLGLPTVWVPHAYPGCAQHAPNEHQLASVSREAMGIMAGLFWDLGERSRGAVTA